MFFEECKYIVKEKKMSKYTDNEFGYFFWSFWWRGFWYIMLMVLYIVFQMVLLSGSLIEILDS